MKEMFRRSQMDFAIQEFWQNQEKQTSQKTIQRLTNEIKSIISTHNDLVRDFNELLDKYQRETRGLSKQVDNEHRLSTMLRERLDGMGGAEEGMARWIEHNIRNTKSGMLKLKMVDKEEALSLVDKRDINLRLVAYAYIFYEGLVETANIHRKQSSDIGSAEIALEENLADPTQVVPAVIEKLASARRLSQLADDSAFPGLPGVGSGTLKTRAKRSHEQVLAWLQEGLITHPEGTADIQWHGEELHPFGSMLRVNFAWIKDHLIR